MCCALLSGMPSAKAGFHPEAKPFVGKYDMESAELDDSHCTVPAGN